MQGGVIMHKRIETLQKIFQKALKTKKSIPLGNILFIDDRKPRHTLVQQIPDGLSYLVPTAFRPDFSTKQKEYLLFMAFAAMEKHGLLENTEYMNSPFCDRTIRLSYPLERDIRIKSLQDLFTAVTQCVMGVKGLPWKSDSAALRKGVRDFLQKAKP